MKERLLALCLCLSTSASGAGLKAAAVAPKAVAPIPVIKPVAPIAALQAPAAVAAAPQADAPQAPSAQAATAVQQPRVFDGAVKAAALALAVCVSGCIMSTDVPDVPMNDGGEFIPEDVTPITPQQIYRDIDEHLYDYDHTPGEYYGGVTPSNNDVVYKVRLAEDGFLNVHVDELYGVKYDLLVVEDDGDIVLRDNNWWDLSREHEVIGDLPRGTYYVILHNNNDGALGQTYWLQLYY